MRAPGARSTAGRAHAGPEAAGRAAAVLAGALAAVSLGACAGWSTSPGLTVRVETSVDRPLLIYVNNDWVGTIPARAGTASVPAAGHGGPPWHVEARVDSGQVLGRLVVGAADRPAGSAVTLACGTLGLVVGGGPAPAPTVTDPPQPCD